MSTTTSLSLTIRPTVGRFPRMQTLERVYSLYRQQTQTRVSKNFSVGLSDVPEKLQEVKCLNGEGIVVLILLWMIFIICTKNISLILDNAGHNRYMNLLHVHEIIYETKHNNTVIHTFLKRLQNYYYFIIFSSWNLGYTILIL